MTELEMEQLNQILRDHNIGLDVATVALIALFVTHPDRNKLAAVYRHWMPIVAPDAKDAVAGVPRTLQLKNALETALKGGYEPPRFG